MDTNSVAAPAGQSAESTPAPEPEQQKPGAVEERGSEPTEAEAQGAEDKGAEPPAEEGKRKRGLSERALEYRNQARDFARLQEKTLAVLEKVITTGQKPAVQAPDGPPQRENFETFEAYLEAKADFQLAQRLEQIERHAEQVKQRSAIESLDRTWEDRIASESAKDEEFEAYIDAVGTKITPLAGMAIKDAEKGVEIVRYLGENPAELKRLSGLNPAAQVREIGKIEARLETPAAKPSKAPPPITPVNGSANLGSLHAAVANAKTQAQYEQAMNKLLEAEGKRRW